MEAPPLERKLVAILAADIQGYSRLMSIAEEDTLATLSAHRAITDAIIAQHGGRICSTAGDSILAEFASVFAAVQCAVEIQRDLAQANLALGHGEDERDYTAAAQMLTTLGAERIDLLTNNPDKTTQLAELGIDVRKVARTAVHASQDNLRYLRAKVAHTGHTIALPRTA